MMVAAADPIVLAPTRAVALGLVLGLGLLGRSGAAEPGREAERRALAYLEHEVPRWARENHCYSCHNNGDAARALYDARSRAEPVAPGSVEDTTRWLSRPEGWDHNGGEGPFSDKRLARVQFAASLVEAVRSGALADRGPLTRAAERLAADQSADGSWPIEDGGRIGSPASYGRPLATLVARDTLRAADPEKYREAVARADGWLRARPVASILDASIAILATSGRADAPADPLRARAFERLREGQSGDGGWGPFVDTPPEPFDTALALLALARLEPTAETRAMVRRGRAYLASVQSPDGSWTETTRPPGAESYAQRLSTAGWATLALLATRDPEP
jgi:hypothetical protein